MRSPLVIEGLVTKWPSTVSLNWSMAGTTTSMGRSSLVRLAMEHNRSKSMVFESWTRSQNAFCALPGAVHPTTCRTTRI